MATPRQALNRTVAFLMPPIGALIAERNRLRAENSRLVGETHRLIAENEKLAARFSAPETGSDIRDEFYTRGFVVLRGAIDPRRVNWFFTECLQPATTFLQARSITDADSTVMNRYYGVPWDADTYRHLVSRRYITDRMLRFATFGRHNFFELLSEPIWSAISFLSPAPFSPSVFAHCRSIHPNPPTDGHFHRPSPLHYDRPYHGDGDFVINVWCPLQDVGETFGRPSLSFIPLPLNEIVPLLRNNGDLLRPNTGEFEADPRFEELVAGREFVPIELAAGDVAIFSNWTLHKTYITPSMTEGRTSAEIRMLGNSETFLQRLAQVPAP